MFTVADQPHGFFNRPPWQQQTTARMDVFLTSLGYLKEAKELQEKPYLVGMGIGLPPKTWSSLNGNRTTGREPGSDSCENDPDRTRSRLSSATSKPISTPA